MLAFTVRLKIVNAEKTYFQKLRSQEIDENSTQTIFDETITYQEFENNKTDVLSSTLVDLEEELPHLNDALTNNLVDLNKTLIQSKARVTKSFVCDKCSNKFSHKNKLKTHLFGQHFVSCKMIKSHTFQLQSIQPTIKTHQTNHCLQSLFFCKCSKAFKSKRNFTKHKCTESFELGNTQLIPKIFNPRS
jgi:hypothetical protein